MAIKSYRACKNTAQTYKFDNSNQIANKSLISHKNLLTTMTTNNKRSAAEAEINEVLPELTPGFHWLGSPPFAKHFPGGKVRVSRPVSHFESIRVGIFVLQNA